MWGNISAFIKRCTGPFFPFFWISSVRNDDCSFFWCNEKQCDKQNDRADSRRRHGSTKRYGNSTWFLHSYKKCIGGGRNSFFTAVFAVTAHKINIVCIFLFSSVHCIRTDNRWTFYALYQCGSKMWHVNGKGFVYVVCLICCDHCAYLADNESYRITAKAVNKYASENFCQLYRNFCVVFW